MPKEVVLHHEKFLSFDFKSERLDSFFHPLVGVNPEYSDLWRVMIIIFVLNHGQSFTERGFSINKLTSDVNMEEESLIAQRVIYDALSSANADAATFPISKQMRESCKKARQRQKLAAEQKKSDEVSSASLK